MPFLLAYCRGMTRRRAGRLCRCRHYYYDDDDVGVARRIIVGSCCGVAIILRRRPPPSFLGLGGGERDRSVSGARQHSSVFRRVGDWRTTLDDDEQNNTVMVYELRLPRTSPASSTIIVIAACRQVLLLLLGLVAVFISALLFANQKMGRSTWQYYTIHEDDNNSKKNMAPKSVSTDKQNEHVHEHGAAIHFFHTRY